MNNSIAILITNLKKRRIELCMTQKEVADRCGLKQANYSRMESGKQAPTLDTLLEIASVLRLSVAFQPCDIFTYHIMHMDKIVAIVRLSYDKKNIEFEKIEPDGPFQPFSGDKLDLERFYRFIKGRCYEDGRADLRNILHSIHLSSNNPYEFIKVSHGVTFEDHFWIQMDYENLKWKDVRIR